MNGRPEVENEALTENDSCPKVLPEDKKSHKHFQPGFLKAQGNHEHAKSDSLDSQRCDDAEACPHIPDPFFGLTQLA